MTRDVTVYKRPRGNKNIVTDRNTSDDGGVSANPHTVSQNWRFFSLTAVLSTDRRALMQVAVRAENRSLIHRDVKGVPEVEPRSDLSGTSYLQAASLLQTVKQQTPNGVARAMRLTEDEEESGQMIGQRRSICSRTATIEAPPEKNFIVKTIASFQFARSKCDYCRRIIASQASAGKPARRSPASPANPCASC